MKLKPLYPEPKTSVPESTERIMDLLLEDDDEQEYPEYDDVPPAI
jgi:hypothetical protein